MQKHEKVERNLAVIAARRAGKTGREVAWEFGICVERVYQIEQRAQHKWLDGHWMKQRRGFRRRWVRYKPNPPPWRRDNSMRWYWKWRFEHAAREYLRQR